MCIQTVVSLQNKCVEGKQEVGGFMVDMSDLLLVQNCLTIVIQRPWCFIEQGALLALLSTGWFQEWVWPQYHNQNFFIIIKLK